jgi:hypothetical protein
MYAALDEVAHAGEHRAIWERETKMKKIEEREHLIAVRLELGQTVSQTSARRM